MADLELLTKHIDDMSETLECTQAQRVVLRETLEHMLVNMGPPGQPPSDDGRGGEAALH